MTDLFRPRQEKLLSEAKKEGVTTLLLTNPSHVSYLTGFSGESSYLIVSPDKTVLVSDGRFTTQIEEECAGLEKFIRRPSQSLVAATADNLQSLKTTDVEFDSNHLTVSDWENFKETLPSVNWKAGAQRVEKLRMVKDEYEIGQIKEAIRMAERAFAMFRAMMRADDTEKELADSMEMYVRRAGGQCTSFPPIVALGERAALPHAVPTQRKVAGHNLLLVDWGASGTFYKSDLTRVLIPRTKISSLNPEAKPVSLDELRKVYNIVLQAQEKAIQTLRPGVKSGDVDAAARQVISDAGYGDRFNHSIGHGIGINTHEGPIMRPDTKIEIQAGMVVTIEPGIYIPGWGGVRIEDDVLVTPEAREVLTNVTRDFDEQFVDC